MPDVLYVVHRLPYPPDKGDRIRTYHILEFLSRRCKVHLACLADEPVPASSVAALNAMCARVAIVPTGRWLRWLRALFSLGTGGSISEGAFASPSLRNTIRAWAKDTPFHAVLASSSSMAPYLRLPELTNSPAVVDLIDLDSQKWLDYAAASKGFKRRLYALEGSRLRRLEGSMATWAHGIMLVSEPEVELYRQCCGDGPVHAVGNGVDLEYFQVAPQAADPTCVFVGALDYRPNVDGACWFCQEVWPAIRQARPDATLALVGRQPTPAVKRLGEIPGVTVVGQVPDVRPYLTSAAVAVVPLRIARGIQNKVLEALAMARATVASPQALEGLKLNPGIDALSASTKDEWVRSVLELLGDGALRQRLGQSGRRYVEQNHCWDVRCAARKIAFNR